MFDSIVLNYQKRILKLQKFWDAQLDALKYL